MKNKSIYVGGSTAACRYAATYLSKLGLQITESPNPNIRYLLLDTPAFGPDGQLRGGGSLESLLKQLPRDLLVCGGNINHPCLDEYDIVDFLKDEKYLCENAYITAECALDAALPYLKHTIRHCPVLIIGWGRIGKCLARILRALDADVSVSSRDPKDCALIHALGYGAVDTSDLPLCLNHFHLIYNTAPYPVLNREQMNLCRKDSVKIELASVNGMDSDDVVIARGLPGIHMPESSGKLIADTFIRLCYRR